MKQMFGSCCPLANASGKMRGQKRRGDAPVLAPKRQDTRQKDISLPRCGILRSTRMASHPQGIHPNLAPRDRRSPWWAIATGVSITVAINAVIPYTHHYMHTISLVEGMIPMGILMPFLVLIFVVNPVLRALGCALQPWELIFIFAVGYASMSINELLGRVLATYAVMHYMATPENLWKNTFLGWCNPISWSKVPRINWRGFTRACRAMRPFLGRSGCGPHFGG